jgi:RNA polymerase sigma-70 factor, ECF subfamily
MKTAAPGIVNEVVSEDSFEQLFLDNYRQIYALLYRFTGQKMEAEDLTVETFVRYLQLRSHDQNRTRAWLYRVAMNLGYNALRALKRRTKYEGQAALFLSSSNSTMNPDHVFERNQQRAKVRNILRKKMSRRDVEILLLYHSGFSYKEIAEMVQVAPNSVGTLLSRAQKKFETFYLK